MLELLAGVGCKRLMVVLFLLHHLKMILAESPTECLRERHPEIGVDWKNGVYVGDKITDPKSNQSKSKVPY